MDGHHEQAASSSSSATYLRAQFGLNEPGFLPISHGDIFLVHGRHEPTQHLLARNVFTGADGLIPRKNEQFYVSMRKQKVQYVQPVVLYGSLANHVFDLLSQRAPTLFASPVPHTTRPKRITERNGVHYNFVRKATMDQMIESNLFIDCVELDGHLYGTTEAAIRQIAQKEEKHCLLDGSTSITRLHNRGIFPIVLFVGAQTWKQLYDVICFEGASEYRARELFAQDAEVLQKKTANIQAVIRAPSLEATYSTVLATVERLRNADFVPILGDPHQRLI